MVGGLASKTPAKNRAQMEARRRAAKRLKELYPQSWRTILAEEVEKIRQDPRYREAWDVSDGGSVGMDSKGLAG